MVFESSQANPFLQGQLAQGDPDLKRGERLGVEVQSIAAKTVKSSVVFPTPLLFSATCRVCTLPPQIPLDPFCNVFIIASLSFLFGIKRFASCASSLYLLGEKERSPHLLPLFSPVSPLMSSLLWLNSFTQPLCFFKSALTRLLSLLFSSSWGTMQLVPLKRKAFPLVEHPLHHDHVCSTSPSLWLSSLHWARWAQSKSPNKVWQRKIQRGRKKCENPVERMSARNATVTLTLLICSRHQWQRHDCRSPVPVSHHGEDCALHNQAERWRERKIERGGRVLMAMAMKEKERERRERERGGVKREGE